MIEHIFESLLISACLGALIGLERQWETQQVTPDKRPPVGLRTFAIWSMFGTLAAYIGEKFVASFYVLAFGSLIALLLLPSLYVQKENGKKRRIGMTTVSVALLTFLIGSLVYWQERQLAVTLTISIIILLSSKETIHDWSTKLTREDVRSALQFAAITGVILPLVPNQSYGPFAAFNPYSTWLMVVLVAGLGFMGYAAMRMLGARTGIGVTGLVGGLASSTATTLAFSKQSKKLEFLSNNFALAVVLACTIMLPRVAFIISLISLSVFRAMIPALILMMIPGISMAIWWWRRAQNSNDEVQKPDISNPLSLQMAIKFALAYALIVFLAKVSLHYYGGSGIMIISVISGITEMDAIAISLSQMTRNHLIEPSLATQGIILAAMSNTVFKAILAVCLGSKPFQRLIMVGLGATLILGAISLLFT